MGSSIRGIFFFIFHVTILFTVHLLRQEYNPFSYLAAVFAETKDHLCRSNEESPGW